MLRYYKPKTIPFYKGVSRLYEQIESIIRSGSYTNGAFSSSLCTSIAERTGYANAIPLGSGTQAIFMIARWYWNKGYRKIRVPAFTWPSTYKPFEWLGYKVRFVDIDRDTWLADFGGTPPAIDELDIPVDTFGSVYPHTGWDEDRFTDSAQSFGASWPNPEDGMPNRIVSLSGSKIVTSGEGGILLTQDQGLADFARNQSWFSRLPELSAALGLTYIDQLDIILKEKADIAGAYKEAFPGLQWQKIPVSTNNYIVAALVDSPKAWQKVNPGFGFRFYYDSIVNEEDERSTYEETFSSSAIHLPNTEYVSRHIIAFPSWPDMPIERIKEMNMP